MAIYLQRPTRERVATILTGFRSARINVHSWRRFSAGRNVCDGQTCQSHGTQQERCGTNAKPSVKRARKGFNKGWLGFQCSIVMRIRRTVSFQ